MYRNWEVKLQKIEKLRDNGVIVIKACEKVGVSKPTYYYWLKKMKKPKR